mmetsp:Transcript_3119/g.7221  ORF Transcript_3119/g.7221 Transcript_3119/m.7221 type:complete len:1718 (+) Transcript_3119:685-5838(+)
MGGKKGKAFDGPPTYEQLSSGLPPKSLWVLSLQNPIRKVAVTIVKNKKFDKCILFLILLNCIFLAMSSQEPNFERSPAGLAVAFSEDIFTAAFVLELVLKVIAMGFCYDDGSYLRDSWNIMDFSVVVLGLLGYLPGVGNFSGIRTVRVLRPLRTITGVEGMRVLVVTLLKSLPMLFDVLVLVSFAFFIFGIIGVQLFSGRMRNKCGVLQNPEPGCEACGYQVAAGFANCSSMCALPAVPVWDFGDEEDLCSGVMDTSYPAHGTGGSGRKCDLGTYCTADRKIDLPNFGFTTFDNIMWAWLTIFQCISMEGWTFVMYLVMDSVNPWTWVFFVLMIVFGSFFAVNLALAVLYVYFTGANDGDDDDDDTVAAKLAAEEKAKADLLNPDDVPVTSNNKLVVLCYKVAMSKPFENVTMGLICLNTVVMAAEFNTMPSGMKAAFEGINYFLFTYFVMEMAIKLTGFGFKGYVKDQMNIFDGFVVTVSCLEVLMGFVSSGGGGNYLSVLRSFRLLRVFKLARTWKQLNQIISTIFKSLASISYLSLILMLFIFIFALLGMQFFGYQFVFCNGYGLEFAAKTCPAGMSDTCPRHPDCYAPCPKALVGEWVTFNDAGGVGGICKRYSGEKWNPATRLNDFVEEEHMAWLGRSDYARHNFDNIYWSIITIFQILTGENWNEVMYDGMRSVSTWACLYFIFLVVVGNYIILNLFLAILLDNFGSSDDEDDDDEEEAEAEKERAAKEQAAAHKKEGDGSAGGRAPSTTYNSFIKENAEKADGGGDLKKESGEGGLTRSLSRSSSGGKHYPALDYNSLFIFSPTNPVRMFCVRVVCHKYFEYVIIALILLSSILLALDGPTLSKDGPFYPDTLSDADQKLKNAIDILDAMFLLMFVIEMVLKVIMMGFILHPGSYLRNSWNILDFFIVVIGLVGYFADGSGGDLTALRALRTFRALRPIRMASRAEGMKVVVNALFQAIPGIANVSFVCLLFYLIFGILGLNLFMGKMYFCQDMEAVGDHLIPENVGMADRLMTKGWCNQDLGAHFFYCPVARDPLYGNRRIFTETLALPSAEPDDWSCAQTKEGTPFVPTFASKDGGQYGVEWQCTPGDATLTKYGATDHFRLLSANNTQKVVVTSECEPRNYVTQWTNPRDYNFDNIGQSMLTLFEIATLENWLGIMYHGVDMTEIDVQPIRDHNPFYCIFFVVFIIVGSFFVMNLFVGVTIDKFNEMKEKQEGKSVFLTAEQRNWVSIQKLLVDIHPTKKQTEPEGYLRGAVFRLISSDHFDAFILTLIVLNIIVMAMTHADMTPLFDFSLFVVNTVFAAVFLMEAVLKLFALHPRAYFSDAWNSFDFGVVCLSVVGFTITVATDASATYLSLLRVFRVARIFRLIPKAKGLRTLFQTLLYSLPALGNVGSVLFLFFFIFAVMGMNLFGKIKVTSGEINRYANFEQFYYALLTLFRMSTGEAWNGLMHDCMIERECVLYRDPLTGVDTYLDAADKTWQDKDEKYWTNQCTPHPIGAILFFTFFVILCAFVMLNLVIAVILDNFQSNSQSEEAPVSKDHMARYTEVWSQLDPYATYYISASKLQLIVQALAPPLGINGLDRRRGKSDTQTIIMSVDIPNHDGNIHFLETLHALAGRIAGTELPEDEEVKIRGKIADRLPTFTEGGSVPKYTAAHYHAALYVQAAVRGFLARYQMRNKLAGQSDDMHSGGDGQTLLRQPGGEDVDSAED